MSLPLDHLVLPASEGWDICCARKFGLYGSFRFVSRRRSTIHLHLAPALELGYLTGSDQDVGGGDADAAEWDDGWVV